MISDILSDAVHDIREYLNDPDYDDVYQGEVRQRIERVLKAMEDMRIELDRPPP